MAPSLPLGAIIPKITWYENRQAGHLRTAVLRDCAQLRRVISSDVCDRFALRAAPLALQFDVVPKPDPVSHMGVRGAGRLVRPSPALAPVGSVRVHNVEGDRGPVLVTIEYRVDPKDRAPFLKALFGMSRERRHDGAYSWRAFEDPAVEGRFVEAFLTESWREHLRQHSRVTKTDQLYEETLRWCVKGDPPVTTHLIQVHPPG